MVCDAYSDSKGLHRKLSPLLPTAAGRSRTIDIAGKRFAGLNVEYSGFQSQAMAHVEEEVQPAENHSLETALGPLVPRAHSVSPYAIPSQLENNNFPHDTKVALPPASKASAERKHSRASTPVVESHIKLKFERCQSSGRMPVKAAAASRPQCKTDPLEAFDKEESKILNIVRCQQTTVLAFSEMNSYTDGDLTISLRELSYWLPINLPRLNNLMATKLAIKNAHKISNFQESRARSREQLLSKMLSSKKDVKKDSLDMNEIPSFLQNLLAYHRVLNLVSRIDPSGELKLTKLEVFLFLKSIRISSSSESGKGLLAKIDASGSISFAEMCRISFDLGFFSFEVNDAIVRLSSSWNFDIQKPEPKPPIVRKIKSHEEVFSEMQTKILKQTRAQDVMSASIVPYMVKSRLREIKQRQMSSSLSGNMSASPLTSCQASNGIFTNAGALAPKPCGNISSLWGQGSTPRQINSQTSTSLMISPSIASRTQRSFEQGSILDSRRQNPLYIDTENGETIYDMPVHKFDEYMKLCPMAQEPFKRVINQPELNPLAFATSRTPRLYGVHTPRPGVVRRDFVCSSVSNTFFHNADINLRRQYRPCTAGSLRPGRNSAKEESNMPGWCFGAVPWNGKSTELPKYSGDIGYFEPNQYKKRLEEGKTQAHAWTATGNGETLLSTKIKAAKFDIA
jgi:hypothetical protein